MSIIDSVLQRITSGEIMSILGGEFSHQGHNYCGKCPSGHDSKSGRSFMINTLDPTFTCFNCGAHGNYIHAVELMRHKSSSAGRGFTENFKETLLFLAERYGLCNDNGQIKKDESVLNIIDMCIEFYASSLNDDVSAELMSRYGWDADFIKSERMGYGAKCPSSVLLEFYSVSELLESGLFNKTKSGGVFHIYQDRIVFPYSIGGRARYSIGRKTDKTTWFGDGEPPKYFKQYTKKADRDWVSDQVQNIIIKCGRDTEEVFITEGIADYLQLKRHGLNSMSAVTVQFKKEHYEQVIEFCRTFRRVYICNDSDDNQAGQKGAARIASKLVESGILPFIVELPMAGDKMDVAEYVRDYGINAFITLKNSSRSSLEHALLSIPNNTDKLRLSDSLSDILESLSFMPDEIIHAFIYEKIKNHFSLSRMVPFMNQIRKKVMDIKKARVQSKSNEIFNDSADELSVISSGQDYLDGRLHYTVTHPELLVDETGCKRVFNKVFVVNSDRVIKEVIDGQIITDKLILARKLNPEFKSDRWRFNNSEYSVNSFINKKIEVTPQEIYSRIKTYFDKYIYFKNPNISSHLAIVIMTSYHYMCFHSVGYIHLWAEKRSGKTTALEIMSELGFNARMSSSISDAAIFRLIEMYRPLLLIDEAENLNPTAKQRENSTSERLELFKSGYKKTGSATRCEGQNNVVTDFSNYCIKGFSSIKTLDATLEDRTITHEFKRMPGDIKRDSFIPANHVDDFNELRDMLHVYGLMYSKDVEKIYNSLADRDDVLTENKVVHRTREIWAAYLSVALLVDGDSVNDVFMQQISLARASTETRDAFSGDGGKPIQLIEMFYVWASKEQDKLLEGSSNKNIYMKDVIIDSFIKTTKESDKDDEWGFISYNYLKGVMRRYHIIDKDSELQRVQIANVRGAALVVTLEKIQEALSTYKPDSEFAKKIEEEVEID